MFVRVTDHPLLDLAAVDVDFGAPLADLSSPDSLTALLAPDTVAPMTSSDTVRASVRRLLRHGGFKAAGRNKPASEYLLKASAGGFLEPINVAVDLINAVSLHSGLPISVLAVEKLRSPLTVDIAPPESGFVFNNAGHRIDVSGLVGLSDSVGACANAVKDSQRTKTDDATTEVLVLIWGTLELPGRTRDTARWLMRLASEIGATCAAAGT